MVNKVTNLMHKFLFYNKFILLYYGQTNVLQKVQVHVMKDLNKKLTTENAIITWADKGKNIVIINSNEYSEKVHSFLTVNNFNILTKDPTDKFHNLVHKTLQENNLIIDKKQIKLLTQKKASPPTLKESPLPTCVLDNHLQSVMIPDAV